VFRLVQESLTNIGRHAFAERVVINLQVTNEVLQLRVKDDGVGFQLDKPRPRSFGLRGVRERVLALNGQLRIHSQIDAGTLPAVEVPLGFSMAGLIECSPRRGAGCGRTATRLTECSADQQSWGAEIIDNEAFPNPPQGHGAVTVAERHLLHQASIPMILDSLDALVYVADMHSG